MYPTTRQLTPPFRGLSDALGRLIRPAIGFQTPDDVVKDPDLSVAEKRAVLSSWASDACAVMDHPHLRWLLGSPEPVPLFEVLDALARLDRKSGRWDDEESPASHPGLFRPSGAAGRQAQA